MVEVKNRDDNKEECELHQIPEEIQISRLQIISAILGLLNAVCWIIWVIGYPIYCVINNIEVFEGGTYAIVTSMMALTLNIFNSIFKISGHKDKEEHNE